MVKKRKKPVQWQTQVLLIFVFLAMIAAMPTTIMLFLGMLPTMVAIFVDRTHEKTRALSVGAMNLAGCSPFILQLWTTHHAVENAMAIISDPRTIVVMYCAAGVGYIIDWAVSGLVGGMMIHRAKARREQIRKIQASLVERWGREVTGEIPVDAQGFPLAIDEGEQEKPA